MPGEHSQMPASLCLSLSTTAAKHFKWAMGSPIGTETGPISGRTISWTLGIRTGGTGCSSHGLMTATLLRLDLTRVEPNPQIRPKVERGCDSYAVGVVKRQAVN